MKGDAEDLRAYMATALTSLTTEQMRAVEFICDKAAMVCRSHGIDLYEPRKKTAPDRHKDIRPVDVYYTDREKVSTSDLVLLLADHASHGAGMEMEIAAMAAVPVLVLVARGTNVTRMILGSFIHKGTIEYEDPEGLQAELGTRLAELVPTLRERRDSITLQHARIGKRIGRLRHERGMDRSDLANLLGVSESYVLALETMPDKVSNPSIFLLNQMANALGTTVSDLISGYSVGRIASDPTSLTNLNNLHRFSGAAWYPA